MGVDGLGSATVLCAVSCSSYVPVLNTQALSPAVVCRDDRWVESLRI